MAIIINKQQIEEILAHITTNELVDYMEQAFIAYSNNQSVVPPVGELIFDDPKGEAHIKYGYIKGGDSYCIKIASGFYDNPKLGIPSSQGMMLLFNQKTGQPQAVLLDEGWLTDIRTAAAGALAAKYFAPKNVKAIGIIGTGIQAKLQLQYLAEITPCRRVWVWGRNLENAQKYKAELASTFDIQIAQSPAEVAQHCNLIVTTTPSANPLLQAKDIQPGTHITAMGSDTAHKQELDSAILKKADIVISDSIPQSKSRGEIYHAMKEGAISSDKIVELGNAIQDVSLQRTSEDQISVVDLTGVAVQDIMIANAVYSKFS
jgi:ornithine cyclodeaminase